MKAPRIRLALMIPALGLLRALGIGLLVVALAQILLISPFSNFAGSDAWEFTWFVFAAMFASVGASLVSALLMAIAIWEMLRRPTPPAASEGRIAREFRFVHAAVLAHAAVVLATLLTSIDGGLMPPSVFWTSLAGAPTVLAMLNGLRWDARLALAGAAASVATFGCAVWFAPVIYGRDLRPFGWYAILVAAVPVLAFLIVFLRRAPPFRRRRILRYGLAAALFIALAGAVGFQMAANPGDEFSERLQAALDARPSQIGFSDLTGFEWDTVEVYGEYAGARDFSPAAREGADITSRTSIGGNISADLIVFVKDGETVHYELVWHDGHWFRFPSELGNPVVLNPEYAVFGVEYRPDGYRELTLAD